MSSIQAILDAAPMEALQGKAMVTTTLTKVAKTATTSRTVDYLRKIVAQGGLKGMAGPMRWQREIHEDRASPGWNVGDCSTAISSFARRSRKTNGPGNGSMRIHLPFRRFLRAEWSGNSEGT